MSATILSVVALALSWLVMRKHPAHWPVVLVFGATVLYSLAMGEGFRVGERSALALLSLIPLATSITYIRAWEAPQWIETSLVIGWLILAGLTGYAPHPAEWWDLATIGPYAVSTCVGIAALLQWCGPSLASRRRRARYLRGEHVRLPIYVPLEWTITRRIAALWLVGDFLGLILSKLYPPPLEHWGQVQLALISIAQMWWIILETRSVISAPRA